MFARAAKSITLSSEAATMLGMPNAAATPNEIIRAVLRMRVDLFWNGGIGTYVKASDERNGEIGDRSNDGVRVNGAELAARVVGEGGNLGFTQRGRIEYALAGGRLNTDFIDNSAGVNTSDVEVNLKILLNPLVAAGKPDARAAQPAAGGHEERGGRARTAQQLPAIAGHQHPRAALGHASFRVLATHALPRACQ